jgi:hypothetical protein
VTDKSLTIRGNQISFRRRGDGTVAITASMPTDRHLAFVADPAEWAEIVAAVSAQGAAPERVGLIRNFHMYTPAGVDANGSPVEDQGGKPT